MSLSESLKKRMKKQLDREKAKAASNRNAVSASVDFYRPEFGRNVFRLLPDVENGLLFFAYKAHVLVRNGWWTFVDFDWLLGCDKPGKHDDIISFKEYLINKGALNKADILAWQKVGDPVQAIARAMKAQDYDNKNIPWSRYKYLLNVWNLKDKAVQIWDTSKTRVKEIENLLVVPEFDEDGNELSLSHDFSLFDSNGYNVTLEKTKEDNGRIKYGSITKAGKKSKLPAAYNEELLYNLLEVCAAKKFRSFPQKVNFVFEVLGDTADDLGIMPDTWLKAISEAEQEVASNSDSELLELEKQDEVTEEV